MQIKFDATKEELDQLAIISYISYHVMNSSGRFSTGYKYPKMEIFDTTLRKIYKAILEQDPKTKLAQINGNDDSVFTSNIETEQACHLLLEQYTDDVFLERICTEITERDFIEQGGQANNASSLVSEIFASIYANNMRELKEYGLSRFKILE